MARLRAAREQLTAPAQTLLREIEKGAQQDLTELIISLRGNTGGSFESAAQIINLLEELYQRNWINIRINSTSGQ
jgi:C-terminal processing protease CtpA/Prc